MEVLKATLPRVTPHRRLATLEAWVAEVKRLVGMGCVARAFHDNFHGLTLGLHRQLLRGGAAAPSPRHQVL